jgi:hypothetical protein
MRRMRCEKKFSSSEKYLAQVRSGDVIFVQKSLLIMIRSTSDTLDAHIKEAKRTAMVSSPSLFLLAP